MLVEHDDDIVEFSPMEKFKALEAQTGAGLLNPFGLAAYEVHDNKGEEPTQFQEAHIPSEMSAFELSDLVDEEHAHHNGLSCMIEFPDRKHIHKARVLHEFTKYSRELNLMGCLRRVANVMKFAQSALTASSNMGDDSVTKTQCILIQDAIAVILQCQGVPFLAITQVNLIKVDGSSGTYMNKDKDVPSHMDSKVKNFMILLWLCFVALPLKMSMDLLKHGQQVTSHIKLKVLT